MKSADSTQLAITMCDVSDCLDRFKDMAQSQLGTIQSIEKSMGAILANRDGDCRSLPNLAISFRETP